MVKALVASKKPVTYAEIDAPHGHDAFLLDNPHYHQLIAAYMDNIAGEIGAGARHTPLRLAATELEEMKAYAGGRAGT
jgi:homoserine O-acetyltransferase/O-succinyltransferase